MNSLGFIETEGLIASIESADTMVKTANVRLIKKEYVGKGLVTVIVEGDVGAVKAAVEAGIEAVNSIGGKVHSSNVIPSPVRELSIFIQDDKDNSMDNIPLVTEEKKTEDMEVLTDIHIDNTYNLVGEQEILELSIPDMEINTKSDIDKLVESSGKDTCKEALKILTNKKLKNLASEYDLEESIKQKLSKSNKKELVDIIVAHYEN